MFNLLKNIAINKNWFFEYSRTDYQNLFSEMESNQVHLFVDPIVIDSKFSDSGDESKTYSGKFMLLYSSDVDESYSEKYDKYIKPLMDESLTQVKDAFICSDLSINKFQTVEVINLFDQNLDGILINYSITDND